MSVYLGSSYMVAITVQPMIGQVVRSHQWTFSYRLHKTYSIIIWGHEARVLFCLIRIVH